MYWKKFLFHFKTPLLFIVSFMEKFHIWVVQLSSVRNGVCNFKPFLHHWICQMELYATSISSRCNFSRNFSSEWHTHTKKRDSITIINSRRRSQFIFSMAFPFFHRCCCCYCKNGIKSLVLCYRFIVIKTNDRFFSTLEWQKSSSKFDRKSLWPRNSGFLGD